MSALNASGAATFIQCAVVSLQMLHWEDRELEGRRKRKKGDRR
jgi:hypothetical protein